MRLISFTNLINKVLLRHSRLIFLPILTDANQEHLHIKPNIAPATSLSQ